MFSLSTLVFVLIFMRVYAEGKSCNGLAKYTLRFQGEWTRERHPNFPSGPHFSPIIGCSHNDGYVMWKAEIKATRGVQSVAETGSTSTISREINDEITSKNTYKIYTGRGALNGGTSSDSISNIEVNSTHPLVSFISMIAPSPDWFIGVHDVDLCNTTTGEWVDSVVRNLFPYDAGTDSGEEFSSPDLISNPQQEIHLLTNNITGSFKGDEPIKRFGTFTFEKTSDSNDRTATIAPEATPTNDYTSLIILMGTPTNGYTSSIILIQTPANGYTSSIVTTGVPADGYTFSITPTATANVNTPSTTPNGIATANTNIDITLILMLCILTTVGYIL